MSEAFATYNRHGLELSSFVKYGPKLMKLATERAPKPKSSVPPGFKTIEDVLGPSQPKGSGKKFGQTIEQILASEK